MRPVDWDELVRICSDAGFVFDRQRGDHYIMTKRGVSRPAVIPRKRGLKEDIVLSVARTIGLTRKEVEDKLNAKSKRVRFAGQDQAE
ncbi:MAG: type II toxin-antitoxin system HicA family toxin [Bryobacteraceae bacterium]